jgi:hypothetical protein
MYVDDGRVRVVELHDAPKSSLGAPIPCAVADERQNDTLFLLIDTGRIARWGRFNNSGCRTSFG